MTSPLILLQLQTWIPWLMDLLDPQSMSTLQCTTTTWSTSRLNADKDSLTATPSLWYAPSFDLPVRHSVVEDENPPSYDELQNDSPGKQGVRKTRTWARYLFKSLQYISTVVVNVSVEYFRWLTSLVLYNLELVYAVQYYRSMST